MPRAAKSEDPTPEGREYLVGENGPETVDTKTGEVNPVPTFSDLVQTDPMDALGFTTLEEAEEFTNALLFGMPGSGKTTAAAFAANIPGDGLTVFINAESGLKKSALQRLGLDTSKVVIWPDAEKGEVLDYEGLETLLFRLNHLLREKPGSIKVVGFDSLTEVAGKLMEQITERAYKKDQGLSAAERARRGDKKLRESKFEAQLQDYGLMTNQVKSLIRGFRDLPTHFVATALLRDDLKGEDGIKQTGPELPPKLSESVRGYFDLVFYMRSETVKVAVGEQVTLITAETKTTPKLQAKDRLGVFPVELPNPTFDRIHKYAIGELVADSDEEFSRHDGVRAQHEEFRASRRRGVQKDKETE